MPRIGKVLYKTGNQKNGLLFGTWTVCTLFKLGTIQNIVKEIKTYESKIVILQEIRWNDTGMLDIQETIILYDN